MKAGEKVYAKGEDGRRTYWFYLLGPELVLPFSIPVRGDGTVAGTVSPASGTALDAYQYKRQAATTPAAKCRAEAEFIVAHVRTTNIDIGEDTPLPLTAEAVSQLPPPVFDALLLVAAGKDGVEVHGPVTK